MVGITTLNDNAEPHVILCYVMFVRREVLCKLQNALQIYVRNAKDPGTPSTELQVYSIIS